MIPAVVDAAVERAVVSDVPAVLPSVFSFAQPAVADTKISIAVNTDKAFPKIFLGNFSPQNEFTGLFQQFGQELDVKVPCSHTVNHAG